ncbi:outer membrane lipoprotein-sorting protein [Sulfurimonas sp.]|nr:outer membrane lipoprotein-sorting protein [Sulfurimonas sp.]
MKRYFLLLVLVCELLLANNSLDGRAIIDEVAERHDAKFEFEVQQMVLIDKKGAKESRELRRYSREGSNALFKYLLVFDKPKGVKGVALLTWQNKDQDDDQWMYLPALSKVKRIAKGGSKNYFMGTDYAFEDLVSENRNKFRYEKQSDIVLDGKDCYVVDVYPETKQMKKSSGYKYRKLYIRKDIFFTVQVDYYGKRGKYIKQQKLTDIEHIDGKMYRAKKSVMDNKKEKHVTEIIILKRKFTEKSVPSKFFKQRYIKSGRHIK